MYRILYVLALLPTAALAELYHCEGTKSTVFQSWPCDVSLHRTYTQAAPPAPVIAPPVAAPPVMPKLELSEEQKLWLKAVTLSSVR